jgi:hypothetical protein
MRKRRDSTPPDPYAKMTDAEFRKAVQDECGFDPLPRDWTRARIDGPYTGTRDLIAKYKKGERITDTDLVRQLILILTQSIFLDQLDNAQRSIIHIAACRWFKPIAAGREEAKKHKGEKRKAPLYSQYKKMADELLAKNPALSSSKALGEHIARKLGGKPDTVRKVVAKLRKLAIDPG